MAKKVTSKKVASKASKVLRDGRTSKDSKSAAGSALSQREKKRKLSDYEYGLLSSSSYSYKNLLGKN
jgi:hypothetical protein